MGVRRPSQEIPISTAFEALGLRAELTRAVADEGYSVPTPVQAQAIPVILEGRDILAGAQTGTGKTAGFTLPLLQLLSARQAAGDSRRHVRALILTPTRELAAQVEDSVRTYGRHLRLKSTTVFGGVSMNQQISALRRGVDILVATPGRLLDHLQSRTVDLSRVEILVLDEADRMLDMGFIRDIRRVLMTLPAKRQNLFFSATFSKEIRELADSFLQSPVEVAVARSGETADLVSQVIHPVDKDRKRALLEKLINDGDWRQVLVFARTKHGANRLAEQLDKDGISADAIHGNKSQGQRTRALSQFKDGKIRVLVATDIAARGLDIELLPHVVNYELPNVPEDYVHRIGRTGRAGSSGQAVSLVCAEEGEFLRDIERLLKRTIERVVVDGFAPTVPVVTEGRMSGQQRRPQQRQQQGRSRPQGQGRRDGNGDRWGESRGGGGDARRGQQNRNGAGNRQHSAGDARRRDTQPKSNGNRPVSALLGGNR
ncbi:MAG TPA: DEAD/DEAH box helicase [Burkholderiales bacterium]|nr:DEAD/DEAH box helicase [Burkholderiales bacterium]